MSDFNAASTAHYIRQFPERFEKRRKGMGKKWFITGTDHRLNLENDLRIDTSQVSPEQAVELFNSGRIADVFKLPMTDQGPLHIDWARAPEAKVAVVQLRFFFDNTELTPITDVVELTGPDYDATF